MSGTKFLQKSSPLKIKIVLFIVGPFYLAIRFLLGTALGFLLFCTLLYWAKWEFGEVKPFTAEELLLWVDGLSTDAKTAIATSILTVVGFLVAFQASAGSYKAELLTRLKVDIANEIEDFFNEVSRATTDASIYVSSLVDLVNRIQQEGHTERTVYGVKYVMNGAEKFTSIRSQLSALSVGVHRIGGHHSGVLAIIPGSLEALEDCAEAVSEIAQKSWIRVPTILSSSTDPIGDFLMQVNVEECKLFVSCCDENSDRINGLSGGIRGDLLFPITGLRLSNLRAAYRMLPHLDGLLDSIRKRGKSNK